MATKPAKIIGPNWPALSGRILEGGYEIQELLEADGPHAAFKIRVLGAHTANALIELFQISAEAGQGQLEIWRNAKELSHPNLSVPLSSGWMQSDGADLIYVIVNRPDERLSSALRERALNSQETGELLKSLVAGLEHLHGKGFVHGCVSPKQVLAMGEVIRLSTIGIRRINSTPPIELTEADYVAPEGAVNVTPMADIWCLGATLFEALTQKHCGVDAVSETAQLPPPFGNIARRCLDPDPQTRSKLAEIIPLYNGRFPSRTSQSRVQARKPPVLAEVPVVSKPGVAGAGVVSIPKRTWIYAAIGLIVVLAAIWFARPKRMPLKPEAIATTGKPPVQGSKGSAWETRTFPSPDASTRKSTAHPASTTTPTPTSTGTASVHTTKPSTKQESRAGNGSVWRVILYTYSRQQDAEKKAQAVNAKNPGLNAAVFTPAGNNGLYLVTVGGQMTREDAMRLRQQVRGLGLPRDSYIQNYKQ